jgi:hypothetical protein
MAMAVYSQPAAAGKSGRPLWAQWYLPGDLAVAQRVSQGWQPAILVGPNDDGSPMNPQVAMNGVGEALAVWQRKTDTGFQIQSAAFFPPEPSRLGVP